MVKWVDDHLFIRIKSSEIRAYNQKRAQWRKNILKQGGRHQAGGRIWFGGGMLQDGRTEEFAENMQFPLQTLTEGEFPYSLKDIDRVSEELGISWELQKDVDFSPSVVFTGMLWNIEDFTVALAETKQAKYLAAVE